MENVTQFWSNAVAGATSVLNGFLAGVAMWQVLLAAAILLVLVIILICALSSRNHKCDELTEAQEQARREAERAQNDTRKQIEQKDADARRAMNDMRGEMDRQLSEKEQALGEKRAEAEQLKGNVEELTRFRDEYIQIPNARAEANRIIREAKEHAYVVSNRTEMEYAEIIEHANQEAESIRALAQQRLARSHDALKAALARANEIVEEAHTEASRIAKIAYTPGPGLIEAPTEGAEALNAPEAPNAPEEPEEPEAGQAQPEDAQA